MLTQQQYNDLLDHKISFIIVMPDGQILTDMIVVNSPSLHIVSGSFNPLHIGHKRLFHNSKSFGDSYYEVSLTRDGKQCYSRDQINEIIRQFIWVAPVIITVAPTFAEKRKLFSTTGRVYFHIGDDTARRIKRDYSPKDIKDHNLLFYVYQRGETPFNDDYDYHLMGVDEKITPYTIEARNISSTELRNVSSCRHKII